MSRFIDVYINKTPRLYSDSQVQAAFSSNQFDAVVVGSDQCWRPIYSPNIYSYFLDFLQQEKRIKKLPMPLPSVRTSGNTRLSKQSAADT